MQVFETDKIQVLYEKRRSGMLLITFGDMGVKANGSEYWGSEPARNLDLSVIGFVSFRPNWFPSADMADLAKQLEPIIKSYDQVVLYGHSQGGYAALKHGSLLGATHAIAICPQSTIEPEVIGSFDRRYAAHFDESIHRGMSVSAGDSVNGSYVLYDPFDDRDTKHVKLIASDVSGLNLIKVPMTGHEIPKAYAGSSIVSQLLTACTQGTAREVRALASTLRKSSFLRFKYNAIAAERRHWRWADRVVEKYGSQMPSQHLGEVLYLSAHQSMRRSDFTRAYAKIRKAAELMPNRKDYQDLLDQVSAREANAGLVM